MHSAILHLSDLHGLARSSNPVSIKGIASSLESLDLRGDPVLVAITGDITHKGSSSLYAEVAEFLNALVHQLRSQCGTGAVGLVLVPGNHDINEEYNTPNRLDTIRRLSRGEIACTHEALCECGIAQADYYRFLEDLKGVEVISPRAGDFYRAAELTLDGQPVSIVAFNTSLMERSGDPTSARVLPPLPDSAGNTHAEGLSVALMHHSPGFYQGHASDDFRRFLNANFDVVLVGHGHVREEMTTSSSLVGRESLFSQGVVLSHPGDQTSEFAVLVVNSCSPDGVTLCTCSFSLPSGDDCYRRIRETPTSIRRAKRMFTPKHDFLDKMEGLGARIVHPTAGDIALRDVYIFPTISILTTTTSREATPSPDLRSGETIPDLLRRARHLHVFGAHNSGKTSLLRRLCQSLLQDGDVPVVIDGERLKETSPDSLRRLAESAFSSQYSDNVQDIERYKQLAHDRKVLLVDNLDRSRLAGKPELRHRVLERIAEAFGKSVVTDGASPSILLGDAAQSLQPPIAEHTCCEIRPFSSKLRGQLIERWVQAGAHENEDRAAFLRRIDALEKSVEDVLGKRMYPENPFVVLAVLHFLGSGSAITLSEGSLAALYRMLIEEELAHPRYVSSVDVLRGFLAIVAFHMHESAVDIVSSTQMENIYSDFERETDVSLSLDKALAALSDAWILERRGDAYGFRYPLAYSYFLSHYIAGRVHLKGKKARMSKAIRGICDDLSSVRHLSTLQFLAQELREDPVLVEPLLKAVDSILVGCNELNLPSDTAFLGRLGVGARELALPKTSDPLKAREERRELIDEIRSEIDDSAADDPATRETIIASNAIHILGQLLRQNPASFSSRFKRRALASVYRLGLRMLGDYMRATEGLVKETFAQGAEPLESSADALEQQRYKAGLGLVLYNLTVFITSAILTHVGESAGSAVLRKSMEAVLEDNSAVSFALVDVAMRISCFERFPVSEIQSVAKQIGDDSFTCRVLAIMTMVRLYYYPEELDHTLASQLCQSLGIGRDRLVAMSVRRRSELTDQNRE